MQISSCDNNRLQLAKAVEAKLERARKLALKNDHAGALDAYLFVFDNGKFASGWTNEVLPFVPYEIARLGKKYLPAKLALVSRRDARETLLKQGEQDYCVLLEWLYLNKYLNEQERDIDLLSDLQKRGVLKDSVKSTIVCRNFESLLKDRHYDFLADHFDEIGSRFLYAILSYEHEILLPFKGQLETDTELLCRSGKNRVALEGAKVFELAIGIKKLLQADEIAKRVLLINSSVEAYGMLLAAASRAGSKIKVRELLKQAKGDLSKEDYSSLREKS